MDESIQRRKRRQLDKAVKELFGESSNSVKSRKVDSSDNESILSGSYVGNSADNLTDSEDVDYSDDDVLSSDTSGSENDLADFDDINTASFENDLANWAANSGCLRDKLNDLLILLRANGHSELPKDIRTLLQTPRSLIITDKCGGKYHYNGIVNGVTKAAGSIHSLRDVQVIELTVNIDGLPLAKSTKSQLWPILAAINKEHLVFPIAHFHGFSKPEPVADYLSDFLAECQSCIDNDIVIDGHKYQFRIKAFVCDAPARAYIKGTISHTGYHSCERCTIKGETEQNRRVFHHEAGVELRTDDKFRSLDYHPEHQKVESPLVSLLNYDCVTGFPLDYMHLVLLGVVKRMLKFLTTGPKICRISSNQIHLISERLLSLNGSMPSEFNRQPRGLSELCFWKATEFRQFLLYTGPVVLRGIVTKKLYDHFMCLHFALTILLTENKSKRESLLEYSGKLLKWYVYDCKNIYGKCFTTYNVHSLIHLVDDVVHYGCSLDDISAFKFENHMQALKRKVKNANNPVAQIVKRECESMNRNVTNLTRLKSSKPSTRFRDSCFLTENCEVCFIKEDLGFKKFRCDIVQLRHLESFSFVPAKSSVLDIYFMLKEVTKKTKILYRNQLIKKMVCVSHKKGYVCFPLVHEI